MDPPHRILKAAQEASEDYSTLATLGETSHDLPATSSTRRSRTVSNPTVEPLPSHHLCWLLLLGLALDLLLHSLDGLLYLPHHPLAPALARPPAFLLRLLLLLAALLLPPPEKSKETVYKDRLNGFPRTSLGTHARACQVTTDALPSCQASILWLLATQTETEIKGSDPVVFSFRLKCGTHGGK
jgi:hypothetical protein